MDEENQKNLDKRTREELIAANVRLLELLEKKETEEKKRKNIDFVQLYKNELRQLRALVKLNPTAAQILFVFVEKMNKQNAIIMSFKTLSQITKKSRQTCSKAIKDLRDSKFINIVKIANANAYVINSNVFWTTDNAIKEKFAIFSATVIATSSDQDENFEDWSNVKLKQIPIIYPGEQISLLDKLDDL